MTIINKILQLMNANKTTAASLTKATGLNHSAIDTWKNEKSKPSAEALAKIADYFNVSVDYLLGRTDEQTIASATNTNLVAMHSNINSKEQELLDKYKNLDDWGKQRLENFADALLDSSSSSKNNKKQIN